MRTQTKVAALFAVVLAAVLVALLIVSTRGAEDGPTAADTPQKESTLVRSDSQVLGEPGDGAVTFVEFLDFECEACGAAFPIVEDLREKYAGKVTFVARYFPLPGHFNAERAARAVESAARQGEFEAMYQKMYETQKSWGEAQEPRDDLFRGFAEELGLDMERYDSDYASSAVKERVQRDVDDGLSLGVQATPTFFVNGEPFEPQTVEDFSAVLDEALAE